MKELDLTFVNMANEHAKEMNMAKADTKAVFQQLSEEENKKLVDRFYQKSIQDENHSKSQKIAGELYVGRTSKFQKYVKGTVIGLTTFGVIAGIGFVGNKTETLSRYNSRLNHEAKMQLDLDQQETFHQERDGIVNTVNNAISDLEKIDTAKEELKETGNYNSLGKSIDTPHPVTKSEVEGLFVLSDLEKDAIDQTVDQTIEEYKSR